MVRYELGFRISVSGIILTFLQSSTFTREFKRLTIRIIARMLGTLHMEPSCHVPIFRMFRLRSALRTVSVYEI